MSTNRMLEDLTGNKKKRILHSKSKGIEEKRIEQIAEAKETFINTKLLKQKIQESNFLIYNVPLALAFFQVFISLPKVFRAAYLYFNLPECVSPPETSQCLSPDIMDDINSNFSSFMGYLTCFVGLALFIKMCKQNHTKIMQSLDVEQEHKMNQLTRNRIKGSDSLGSAYNKLISMSKFQKEINANRYPAYVYFKGSYNYCIASQGIFNIRYMNLKIAEFLGCEDLALRAEHENKAQVRRMIQN